MGDRALRVFACVAGAALAVGLFPTMRAIVRGTTPSAASTPVASGNAAVLAAKVAARRAPAGALRVALVGNSVAFDLGAPFKQLPNVAVLDLGNIGCTFPPSVTALYRNPLTGQTVASSPCDPQRQVAPLRIFKPKVVFWLASDAPPPWRYKGRTLKPCSSSYDSIYKRDLEAELSAERSSGATVVLTTEGYVRGISRTVVPLPDSTVDCNNRLRREVAASTGTKLADLFSYACPHGQCITSLRPDGLHYTTVATARWLLAQRTKVVIVYGDSLAFESMKQIIVSLPGYKVISRADVGTAPCDWLPRLRGDLERYRPGVVIVETAANSGGFSKCETAKIDSAPMLSDYLRDLTTFARTVSTTGARLVFMSGPPFLGPLRNAAELHIDADMETLANRYRHVTNFTLAREQFATKMGGYETYAPCLSTETAADGCSSGRIAIRTLVGSGAGLHFCPSGIVGKLGQCSEYSSGEVRFGRLVARATKSSEP